MKNMRKHINLKVFERRGNGSKILGIPSKIKRKRIYNSGKSIKKRGNSSKFEFRGISEKFEEIAETSQKTYF